MVSPVTRVGVDFSGRDHVARFGRPGELAKRDADGSRGRRDVPVLEALDDVLAGFVVGGGRGDQVCEAAA
jgi:hypothetical protein